MSTLYGEAARLRRSWYAHRPHLRRKLPVRVISVGNLSVGGAGKTPVVAALARMLVAAGERPVILSRGYARRRSAEGVIVVSDGQRALVPVEDSGDEPLMLARELPGVPVLVSADRYLAGCLAHRLFHPTVALLDDGFQHLQLERDVDLLVVTDADLRDRVLPAGRLREPLAAARAAHAVLFSGEAADGGGALNPAATRPTFAVRIRCGALQPIGRGDGLHAVPPGNRVVAVAGIARPQRFFASARAQGLNVLRELPFPDHHWFTARDVERVTDSARAGNADLIVTTAKDAVRLEPLIGTAASGARLPWAYLPIQATIEPEDAFMTWLRERL